MPEIYSVYPEYFRRGDRRSPAERARLRTVRQQLKRRRQDGRDPRTGL